MGLRDQNYCKKIGISGPRIYHVTTLQDSRDGKTRYIDLTKK